MGAASPPLLAAAVSEAGALGMVGTGRPGGRSIRGLSMLLDEVHALTSRSFGVNFLVAPVFLAEMEPGCVELAARSARLVEFFYGWPDPELVDTVHAGGALATWQVGTREEARAAAEAGCDLVVVQGIAAGGHVRGKISTLVLLSEVLQDVEVPVLAAGGIGDGRALAAMLIAGASGARVGTRFLAAIEAGAHPTYLEKLIQARAEDTVYTEAFSVGWPDAPHRVLRSCIEAASAFGGDVVGEVARVDGTRMQVPRFEPEVPDLATTGAIDAMSLWAGESVSSITRAEGAGEIVRVLETEAAELLQNWLPAASQAAASPG